MVFYRHFRNQKIYRFVADASEFLEAGLCMDAEKK